MDKKKRKGFFECLSELSRQAELLLLVGLPVIIIEFMTVLCGFLREYEISKMSAVMLYGEIFTYLFMSLTLLIGGALFIDYVIKSYA